MGRFSFRLCKLRIACILLALCLVVLAPANCFSASPGNFLALFSEPDESRGFVMLLADRQTSTFEEQLERRAEVDSNDEERHFTEIRDSEIVFDFAGAKAGFTTGSLPLFYVTAGYARADIEFTFTDQLTAGLNQYSRTISLDSDDFVVLGGGVSGRMYTTPVFEKSRFSIGVDLQYRWLDFEAEEGTVDYESTLHEIQLALAASLENVSWTPYSRLTLVFSPYAGFKIIHFIGDEEFSDPANTDELGDPDPIFYDGSLDPGNHISFFVGTGINLIGPLTLGLETRFGDDESYGIHLVYTF